MRMRKKHWAIPDLNENPYIYMKPQEFKGKWQKNFVKAQPIHLEIGTGRGDFIVEKARQNPDTNYIAMDREANAFVEAGEKIKEAKLLNIIGILGDADNLLEIFGKGEVEKIYINFCNPWPKNRHKKRRLTHPLFLNMYKEILKENSEIEFKTDNDELFEDSIDYFEREGFKIEVIDRDLKVEEDEVISYYEQRWREQNIKIKFLKAKLVKS